MEPFDKSGTTSESGVKLSELEEYILRVLSTPSRSELYGLQVVGAIEEVCNRKISMGTLYPVLHKLKDYGLVSSRWETESQEERKGARRRYYKITNDGLKAIDHLDTLRAVLLRWHPV